MKGQMMQLPLLVSSLLAHAARYHGDTEIVSRTVEGVSADNGGTIRDGIHRYTYDAAHARAQQLANALTQLGIGAGDRVATLAWNGYRHFELYYAVSGMGAVTHTINPRLFPEQIRWIVNHAEDRIVCFDLSFAPLIEQIAPHCPAVEHWIALTDRAHLPPSALPLQCYEDLVAQQQAHFDWPQFDESRAAVLCYTSGTTGDPKGALYSHRSTMLHAFASCLPDAMNLSGRDVILPVVPMFHVNAWGLPYAAAMVGAKLVFPGAALDGASLHALFERENVSFTAGVPTVWLGVLQHLQNTGARLSSVRRMIVGGAACPPSLMQSFEREYGVQLQHAWGMTELSPLGTVNTLKASQLALDEDARFAVAVKQGRPMFGIDLKIVDGEGAELPRDGTAAGDLMVRGHWVIDRYFRHDQTPLTADWFATGDVATLDRDGFMQITDRSKDVIKSGGEWISSIELENVAMSHPGIAEAAAIGIRHPKWDERPLIVAVLKPGASVTREQLLDHYTGKVARWCVPDDVLFVATLPHTATGKLSKLELRKQLAGYRWPATTRAGVAVS